MPSESLVWSDTVTSGGSAPQGATLISVGDRGSDVFAPLLTARAAGWDGGVRAAHDRRMADGQLSLTALRKAKAQGAATVQTKDGEIAVCLSWCPLEILPPRGDAGAPSWSPGSGSGGTAWSGSC